MKRFFPPASPAATPSISVSCRGLATRALLLLVLLLNNSSPGQDPGPSAPTTSPGLNMPLIEISPGLFQLGQARLDKTHKTVSFPAALNMNEAMIEYFTVTEQGKIHESLLRTSTEPYHIHLALLLLGAQGGNTNAFPENSATTIPGTQVGIDVSWERDGKQTRLAAEQLVYNRQAKTAMSKGPWIYNGSKVIEGTFLAQQNGSIISLIIDETALMNNPRHGAENDELWEVNTNNLPPLNWPVQVTINLLPSPSPSTIER